MMVLNSAYIHILQPYICMHAYIWVYGAYINTLHMYIHTDVHRDTCASIHIYITYVHPSKNIYRHIYICMHT